MKGQACLKLKEQPLQSHDLSKSKPLVNPPSPHWLALPTPSLPPGCSVSAFHSQAVRSGCFPKCGGEAHQTPSLELTGAERGKGSEQQPRHPSGLLS